jgi:hypothetical protein
MAADEPFSFHCPSCNALYRVVEVVIRLLRATTRLADLHSAWVSGADCCVPARCFPCLGTVQVFPVETFRFVLNPMRSF